MRTALGKGLEALLPEKGEEIIKIDIEKIIPNQYQPRKVFRDEALQELADSIKERGVLMPVIVARVGDGSFRLIAGERRWRASRLAGLKKIPSLIKDVSSQDSIEIALIENIQREDLNPVETAEAFNRLLKDHNLTQEDLSKKVSKDRATVANYLRILKLPDEIKTMINSRQLSIGHAKALLAIEGKHKQIEAAREILKGEMSVRAAEALCKKKAHRTTPKKKEKLPEVADLEDKLKRALGTKVTIRHKDKRGKIEIEYYSLEELDRLLEILMNG
ncbi:MAG: ParB/RepB/Spo0J family partition protein [Nitrospirae bacterium]|nr:MAG: ParB/RepB/Spo0J family partition protein [Nitrospirota bacterium]